MIKIYDGKKTYNIENQNGEIVGTVTFDPTDTNALRRRESFLKEVEQLFEDLKQADSESDDYVSEKEDEIKEKINAFFNADVIGPFEKIRGLFSPSGNGRFFVEDVLISLFNIVNEEYEKETKQANSRMGEYIDEYTGEKK